MSGKKKSAKEVRKMISEQLKETFKDFSVILGKSRFNKNVKNASKALGKNIKELNVMDTVAKQKKTVKKSKKVPVPVEPA
jgi:hypothetical protein